MTERNETPRENTKRSLARRNVVVGTLCVIAAAALIMSRQSSVVNWVAEIDEAGNVQRLEQVDAADAQGAAPPRANELTESVTGTRAAAAAELPPAGIKQVEPPSDAAIQPLAPRDRSGSEPKVVTASLRSPEPRPTSEVPASSSVSAADVESTGPVTIAGCLDRDGDAFWLKNVSGDDAPKLRSWKSGFLRKRAPSISVVDRGYTHRLANYVGQRIETTGTLADREMRVRAVRVLGNCE